MRSTSPAPPRAQQVPGTPAYLVYNFNASALVAGIPERPSLGTEGGAGVDLRASNKLIS